MKYPIAIKPNNDDKHASSMVVSDLPGCFSAGDTIDEAIVNTKEAIELWLEIVIDDGVTIPEPKTIIQANLEYIGWAWVNVTINLTKLSDKVG